MEHDADEGSTASDMPAGVDATLPDSPNAVDLSENVAQDTDERPSLGEDAHAVDAAE